MREEESDARGAERRLNEPDKTWHVSKAVPVDEKDVIALVTCCRMSACLTQDETLMTDLGKPQEQEERNGMTVVFNAPHVLQL